ncbi:alpha/beta hydrolase family protein [Micromonospora radicis]|uniref:Alpha/beta fold hydrolase n=1 Tax=Micromonospora radicis TaxID=1894971 RepID=A0A418MNT0_9ACTN|nr:alpha/beta fold hydrolase [Micromonospora radicis]RIV32708.1 alpha/beta fold hydrolase [Micromonospora radicis]
MTEVEVVVVTGPDLVADLDLLETLTAGTATALGVAGRLVVAGSAAELAALVAATPPPLVVLPGPTPTARAVITATPEVVWYDPTVQPVVPGAVHLQGRGIWGLAWAIRHAVHRRRTPATRLAYGSQADQWGDLRLPTPRESVPGTSREPRPPAVAVLLHGGFWRSVWGADLMDALAVDLTARGYASWNVEYRRPDRHGWDATTADVAAAVAALTGIADRGALDLGRVVVLGHSAGGQLALRAAADLAAADLAAAERGGSSGRRGAVAASPRVAVAVSLAGVVDLVEGERRQLGEGAVAAALGGTPETTPRRYATSDPLARLPLGVPTVLVQGTADSLDLVDSNRRYAAAARAAGDDLTHLELPGDHFDVIDPGSTIWQATLAEVDRRIDRLGS